MSSLGFQSVRQATNRLLRKSPGTLDKADLQTARDSLLFYNKTRGLSKNQTNSCIRLWERVLSETSMKSSEELSYFADPICFKHIIEHWKTAVERGYDVIKANHLFYILQTSIQNGRIVHFPDRGTYTMLLAGLAKQESRKEAPLLVRTMLDQITERHVSFYNTLLGAWKNSGRPETNEKIEAIQKEMKRNSIEPDDVTRRIISYWYAKQGEEALVQQQLSEIKNGKTITLCAVIAAFCETGHVELAERYVVEYALKVDDRATREGTWSILGSVLQLLTAYIEILNDRFALNTQKQHVIERAEKVESAVLKECALTPSQLETLTCRMLDLYGSARMIDSALNKYGEFDQPTVAQTTSLVRACGLCHRPDLVLELFNKTMKNSQSDTPEYCLANTQFCNTVLLALGYSSSGNAFDQAMLVFDTMKSHEFTPPDTSTFSLLLRCLGRSGRKNIPKTVETLLAVMKEQDVKPDRKTYSFAITACMAADNLKLPAKLLDEMERSDSPPKTKEYNQIILAYAKSRTVNSARHIERIVAHMWDMPASSKNQTRPDTVTYSLAMGAWMSAGSPMSESAQHVIRLYKEMKERGIPGDVQLYIELLRFLAKTEEPKYLRYAEELFTFIKQDGTRKDHRFYAPIMNAWIKLGDIKSAERVFNYRLEHFIQEGGESVQPIANNFFQLAKAWLEQNESQKAREFVDRMSKLHQEGAIPQGPDKETMEMVRTGSDPSEITFQSDSADERTASIQTLTSSTVVFESRGRLLSGNKIGPVDDKSTGPL